MHVGKVLEQGHATCLPPRRSGNLSGRIVLSLVQLTKAFQACLPPSSHPTPGQSWLCWEFGGGVEASLHLALLMAPLSL